MKKEILATLAVCVVVLGSTDSRAAAPKASRRCRATIQSELARVIQLGLANVDKCHRTQSKRRGAAGPCNVVGSSLFDPRGRYAAAKSRARSRIASRCQAGDPVLGNYAGGSVADVALPLVDEAVGGNSVLTLGNATRDGDRKKSRCFDALARRRSAIVKDVVARAIRCQARLDRRAATLGAIEPRCVGTANGPVAQATSEINRRCGGLADLGNCAPLPGCATDASRLAGQGLARAIHTVKPEVVCGDGARAGDEQCDDGNTVGGDGCNARCELEGQSCTPVIGGRQVRVSIDVPGGQSLAGLRLDVDYPQFESGLLGTGTSSIVLGQVSVLQGTAADRLTVANDARSGAQDTSLTLVVAGATGFISSGPLVELAMESCAPLAQNICNRNPNVLGCCPNGNILVCTAGANAGNPCTTAGDCPGSTCSSCFANPVACTTFSSTDVGPGVGPGPNGCCPSDNSCTTQTLATSCAVSSPVNAQGQAVDGVTCTVAIAGT
jgi:cysteine-rich repeat protein